MQQGYGFAGEGDWKTAALLRIMKVMSTGLQGGTSFMEDYTYHFDNGNDSGAWLAHAGSVPDNRHRRETDPRRSAAGHRRQSGSSAPDLQYSNRPGDRRQPDCTWETASVCWSIPSKPSQRRTICRSCRWPTPCGKRSRICVPRRKARIIAGGAHHTVFSHALNLDDMRQFAELHDIELTVIDNDTRLPSFKDALRWNEVYYGSKR